MKRELGNRKRRGEIQHSGHTSIAMRGSLSARFLPNMPLTDDSPFLLIGQAAAPEAWYGGSAVTGWFNFGSFKRSLDLASDEECRRPWDFPPESDEPNVSTALKGVEPIEAGSEPSPDRFVSRADDVAGRCSFSTGIKVEKLSSRSEGWEVSASSAGVVFIRVFSANVLGLEAAAAAAALISIVAGGVCSFEPFFFEPSCFEPCCSDERLLDCLPRVLLECRDEWWSCLDGLDSIGDPRGRLKSLGGG